MLHLGGSGGMSSQKFFLDSRSVLMQSESIRAFMPASLIVIP